MCGSAELKAPKLWEVEVYSAILNVTFDCTNPRRVAEFWSQVTGYLVEEVNSPGNDYFVARPESRSWPRLVFVKVPETKTVKNRVHLDVVPRERDQAAEVDRLLSLGARILDDRRQKTPGGWVVLADPEGNEFCVE